MPDRDHCWQLFSVHNFDCLSVIPSNGRIIAATLGKCFMLPFKIRRLKIAKVLALGTAILSSATVVVVTYCLPDNLKQNQWNLPSPLPWTSPILKIGETISDAWHHHLHGGTAFRKSSTYQGLTGLGRSDFRNWMPFGTFQNHHHTYYYI